MIEKVKEAIADDSLILFVGAGMSMPLKVPNWTNLIIKILEKLHEQHGDKSLVNFKHNIDLLKSNSISVFDVLSQIENRKHRPDAEKILYSIIDKVEYPETKLERHKKLWQISDKIITTNYDTALEAVLPEGIKPYTYDNEFQLQLGISGSPFLYKMHGDFSDPTKCILFESDYRKSYVEENAATQSLRSFLQTKTILFLGFSMEDPFIKDQLDFLNKIYKGHNNTHYIVTNRTTNLDGVKDVPVEDWEESFDTLLDELIEAKKANSKSDLAKISEKKDNVDIAVTTDVVLLEEMFKDKREEFDKAEDHLKKKLNNDLNVIKDRITELKLREINLDFEIPDHEQNELENVFNIIYNSEKLSDQTLQKINKIREQHSQSNEWYHRSVIVSALACSLINFNKKIDPTKIDLLIDFVNDSEERVWQKAITYLFMILNHLGRSWQKHKNLIPKLKHLQTHHKIQEALKVIIAFSQFELQRASPLDKRIFENEYFKESPFNYFLPFYENNPSIDNIYDEDNDGIDDLEGYIKFLYNSPLPDAFKYLMCNTSLNNNNKSERDDDSDENIKEYIRYVLNIHSIFNPYLNYAGEIINFYENNPLAKNTINQKTSIVTFNGLKNILLNTVEHHRALARQFAVQEQWGEAITNYEQLLDIEENDISALSNLINCFRKTKRSKHDILKLRLRIYDIDNINHDNLHGIGLLYDYKKKYKLALSFYNKAIELDSENATYINNRGSTKHEMGDCEGALRDFNKAIELCDESATYFSNRGNMKYELKDYNGALKDFDKAIELDNKEAFYFDDRGNAKYKLGDYDGALKDFDKAIKLDNKLATAYHSKANYFRKVDKLEEAAIHINKAIKLDNQNSRNYGTKAAIYSSKEDDKKFYELLEKAFQLKAKASWLDDDIKEKYRNEKRFQDLLKKYNQTLEEE